MSRTRSFLPSFCGQLVFIKMLLLIYLMLSIEKRDLWKKRKRIMRSNKANMLLEYNYTSNYKFKTTKKEEDSQ